MKKSLITILSLVLLANFTLVMAANEDVIMRLSAQTNAHAGNASSSYTTIVNYTKLFEQTFVLPNSEDSPHRCSSGNVNNIVNLYATTNSHASNKSDSTYTVPVCYGNLRCEVKETCSGGEEPVAKMFRPYNSHMGTYDDSGYTYNVCCVTNYWADMNNNPITTANLGDTVKIFLAPITELNANPQIKLMEDKKYWFDSNLGKIDLTYDSNLMAYIGSIKLTDDLIIGAKMTSDFYFEANGEKIHLYVDFTTASENDPTVVGISNIECGDVFNVSESKTFQITASDSDDIITGSLYINDDKVPNSDFSNGGTTVSHIFAEAGEVKLEVKANTGLATEASYITNVMVLSNTSAGYTPNQNYTAACIASPANYQDFEETLVNFDASTTRGVIIDNTGKRHDLIPGVNPFIFSWTFAGQAYSGKDLTESFSNKGHPENYTDKDYFEFTLIYPGAGTKTADLKVELPSEINWNKYFGTYNGNWERYYAAEYH